MANSETTPAGQVALTEEELAELEQMNAAATPGPWLAQGMCMEAESVDIHGSFHWESTSLEIACANAKLTVAARNALPALLSAAREVESLRASHDAAADGYEHLNRLLTAAVAKAETEAGETMLKRVREHGWQAATLREERDAAHAEAARLREALFAADACIVGLFERHMLGRLDDMTDPSCVALAKIRAALNGEGEKPSEIDINISYVSGQCPVQAEGTIDGKSFYFRARGSRWSLGIGGEPVGAPEWFYEEPYGDEKYAAGWMTIEEAIKFIKQAAKRFLNTPPSEEGQKS